MKIFTNETLIAKKKKQAAIATPVAMVSLLGGLVTNFISINDETANPIYVTLTLVLLAVGFIAATLSAHLVNHWVKEPRPDQVLANLLKGLDNKHFLFNHTSKVPHVLITQNKVYSITPKIANGEISVDERRWKRKFKFGRLLRFFGEEGLGNPTVEAENHYRKLTELIEQHIPEEESEAIPIEPLILFTDPSVELTINNPTIPVMEGRRLKKFLRQEKKGPSISANHRQQLVQIFNN